MLHGSREVFSEEIGGLALVIPREMGGLLHTAWGLVHDRAVHVSDVHVATTAVQSECSNNIVQIHNTRLRCRELVRVFEFEYDVLLPVLAG
jgi:hypothetical protein